MTTPEYKGIDKIIGRVVVGGKIARGGIGAGVGLIKGAEYLNKGK
jgi:hypothetical protein